MRSADCFAIRMRPIHGISQGKWGRKVHARWMHDVLLVSHGPGLGQTNGYPVASQTQAPPPDPATCKGLGTAPVALSIGTDDGKSYEIDLAKESPRLRGLESRQQTFVKGRDFAGRGQQQQFAGA